MKKALYLAALLLFSLPFACEKKSNSIYENCCGAAPTAGSVLIDTTGVPAPFVDTLPKYGTIYIPNIFTPDASGSNSTNTIFMVFGGEGVYAVLSAVFSNENGEIFFSQDTFAPNDLSHGWNGLKPDGTLHYGSFNYEVKVQYIDAQIKTYVGKACSFKCDDSDFPNEKLPDCFFPEQNNGDGMPDQSYPYPKDCF